MEKSTLFYQLLSFEHVLIHVLAAAKSNIFNAKSNHLWYKP